MDGEVGPRMQVAEGEDVPVAPAHADGPRPCGEGGRRPHPRSGANGRRTHIEARRSLHEAMSGNAPHVGERRVAPGCPRGRLRDRCGRGACRPENRLEQPVQQAALRGTHPRRRAHHPEADQQTHERGGDEDAPRAHSCCGGTALGRPCLGHPCLGHPCAGCALAEPHCCRPRRSGAVATETKPTGRFARDPASRPFEEGTMSANHAGMVAPPFSRRAEPQSIAAPASFDPSGERRGTSAGIVSVDGSMS